MLQISTQTTIACHTSSHLELRNSLRLKGYSSVNLIHGLTHCDTKYALFRSFSLSALDNNCYKLYIYIYTYTYVCIFIYTSALPVGSIYSYR